MPSFPSEPPFITALRGVSADVASSVTFAQRLVHFLRLPPIFDRLASVADRDGVENDHRTTAVEFLRQDNDPERGGGGGGGGGVEENRGTRLLATFLTFVLEDEMQRVSLKNIQDLVGFCLAVVDAAMAGLDTRCVVVVVGDDVVESMMSACFRLLYIMQLNVDDDAREQGGGMEHRYRMFCASFKAAEQLVKRHTAQLCYLLMTNEDFLRILISDSSIVSVAAINLLSICVANESFQLSSLSELTLSAFLDELSFKVSSSDDAIEAEAAIQALLAVAMKGDEFVELMHHKYEGLGTLVTRWINHGFDPTIRRLLALLHPSAPSSSSSVTQSRSSSSSATVAAAAVIQKTWRAHQTRRRVEKLARVVKRVQRSFRRRRAEEEKRRHDADMAKQRAVDAETERRKQMRQSRERTLQSVEALPGRDVDEFLQRRETDAATRIQALWKGWKTRRMLDGGSGKGGGGGGGGREAMKREAAARVLQSHWRSWSRDSRAKRKATKTLLASAMGSRGGGEESDGGDVEAAESRASRLAEVEKRKERRLKEIRERCRRGEEPLTREEICDLDDRVRRMVAENVKRKDRVARSLIRCEAALAGLDMDLDLILYPSSLEELVDGVESTFEPHLRQLATPSPSAAIRNLAAKEHSKALKLAREPWTKLLQDEDEEDQEEGEDDDDDDFYSQRKLDVLTEKKLRESLHWKHLAWTLDDNEATL